MLVTEDGTLTGAISGGCLEGGALRKAWLVMTRQQSMVVTYDTADEDDAKFGVGLGCNGIIQILIEPILTSNPYNAVELLRVLAEQRQVAVIATVFSLQNKKAAQQGTLVLATENKTITGLKNETLMNTVLTKFAREALSTHISSIQPFTAGNEYTAFIEAVKPTTSLIIIGAGNDAAPLVHFANILGWQVTVADGRTRYATADRFPSANRIIVSKAADLSLHLSPDEQTAVVLMTHNYNYDLAALRELLLLNLGYIGSLGPKKKLRLMLDDLQKEGLEINERLLQNLYGPVGLDIGAETPEEIALSVIAEIKAVFSGKPATSLREREIPIHAREQN